jgi:hypothetical protein
MSSVIQRILKEFKLLRLKVNARGARAEGVATNSKNGAEVLYGAPPHSTPTQHHFRRNSLGIRAETDLRYEVNDGG